MSSVPSSSSSDKNPHMNAPESTTREPNPQLSTPQSQQQPGGSATKTNEDVEMSDKMTEQAEDVKPDIVEMDTRENIQKFEKYHAHYTRYLKAKYFSGKNLYGGNIFEKEVTVDDMTIKASRWACTRSFTDPAESFVEDHSTTPKASITLPSNRKKTSS